MLMRKFYEAMSAQNSNKKVRFNLKLDPFAKYFEGCAILLMSGHNISAIILWTSNFLSACNIIEIKLTLFYL